MRSCRLSATQPAVGAKPGSEDANRAVDVAAELTKAFGGKLFIVTVAGDLSGEEMRERRHAKSRVRAAGALGLIPKLLQVADR